MDRLIPYDAEIYVALIEGYNRAIWPAQLVALALGWLAVIFARRGGPDNGRVVAAIAAAFWIWCGAVFLYGHLAMLNWAAIAFAAAFVAEGVAIAVWGTILRRMDVRFDWDDGGKWALAILLLAAVLQPVLSLLTGIPLSGAQPFGVTPLTAILASIGLFHLGKSGTPLWLLVWPLLWSAWELAVAVTIGSVADAVTAGVTALLIVLAAVRPKFRR